MCVYSPVVGGSESYYKAYFAYLSVVVRNGQCAADSSVRKAVHDCSVGLLCLPAEGAGNMDTGGYTHGATEVAIGDVCDRGTDGGVGSRDGGGVEGLSAEADGRSAQGAAGGDGGVTGGVASGCSTDPVATHAFEGRAVETGAGDAGPRSDRLGVKRVGKMTKEQRRAKRGRRTARRAEQRSGSVVHEAGLVGGHKLSVVKPAQAAAYLVNSSDIEGELKESVKRKWIAKNRLEALEAERKVAVLEANPVDSEVKAYRTRIGAATERNMVSMEKAHARLRATGNVASEPAGGVAVSGFAETVVDGEVVGGCTISPDSSASQSEFRASQKKVLDLEAKIERMEAAIKKLGLEPSVLDYYNKDEWTLDSQGEVGSEYGKVLDVMYPDGYAVDVPFLDYGERKGRVVPCISC